MSLDRNFVLGFKHHGTRKVKCPNCQHQRKKHKTDLPLAITVNSDSVVYFCHHCNIKGAEFYEETYKQRNPVRREKGNKPKNTRGHEVRKRFGTVW